MFNGSRKSRSRSRSRESRHDRRGSRTKSPEPNSRRRNARHSYRSSRASNSPRQHTPLNNLITQQMELILGRLTMLEEQQRAPCDLITAAASRITPLPPQPEKHGRVVETEAAVQDSAGHCDSGSPLPGCSVSVAAGHDANVTNGLINAIRSINTMVRSNQPYFISNFDPSVNDINIWCEEVDRAKVLNNWSDNECFSRIGNCLKGDARMWLNEWVTNDRSWSNFKREFKPLCPKNPDIANILYEVMSTNSDRYSTYADYARRSLLRLQIVEGLSDKLISAIVVRGIMDPQIRASATNAKLLPNELVGFLSIYVKSNFSNLKRSNTSNNDRLLKPSYNVRKRRFDRLIENGACFLCGKQGHKSASCNNRLRPIASDGTVPSTNKVKQCSYCKKLGHTIETCFAKKKVESGNVRNINFCHENYGSQCNDIVVAVIQSVPVDVLIDSGSSISLISSSLLKHFRCARKLEFRVLRGIGSQEIESTFYVTLPIEFDEITLEVDLHAVPPEFLNTPLIIGTDMLNRKGVIYVRTRDRQHLTYKRCLTSSNVM